MSRIDLIAVFVENKPGQTARITRVLAESAIDLRYTAIASSGSFGVLKFLVSDPERARAVLKAAGMMVSALEVLPVLVPDTPGSLAAVSECLAASGINLENAGGYVHGTDAILLIETHELDRARRALEVGGFRVLGAEELLGG